jgi:GR25 family glycosyltransferase involved in LPS biosynthesis
MTELNMQRYSAIVGKDVYVNHWLTPYAIIELEQTELNNYRLYHYQLTMGAIGCFLSHYNLMKQLIDDTNHDYYFILEDDIVFSKNTFHTVKQSIINAPTDFDMLLFGYIRTVKNTNYSNTDFIKLNSFWGTQGYVISKKGAIKFVNEVDANKIDSQIDAFLSRMIQQNKINIYAYKTPIIRTFQSISDIQSPLLIQPNINPYLFRGFIV